MSPRIAWVAHVRPGGGAARPGDHQLFWLPQLRQLLVGVLLAAGVFVVGGEAAAGAGVAGVGVVVDVVSAGALTLARVCMITVIGLG